MFVIDAIDALFLACLTTVAFAKRLKGYDLLHLFVVATVALWVLLWRLPRLRVGPALLATVYCVATGLSLFAEKNDDNVLAIWILLVFAVCTTAAPLAEFWPVRVLLIGRVMLMELLPSLVFTLSLPAHLNTTR
jgi:hypothetical protein